MKVANEENDLLIRPEDVVIPVMGMTGAGKSTFISLCTNTSDIGIGHGLSSYTSKVSIHTMRYCDRSIHLVDTPGFDDTGRSDCETLLEVAYWLTLAYESGIRFSGMIYLHRITDPRLQGAGLRSLNVFKKICGTPNYPSIVLATTRWDELTPNQRVQAAARHQELCQKSKFWGDITQGGGQALALSAPRIDALNIIRHIVKRNRRFSLNFQAQLVDDQMSVHQTDAGRVLYESLPETAEDNMQQLIDETRAALEKQLRDLRASDQEYWHMFKTQISESVGPSTDRISELRAGIQGLRATWEERLQHEVDLMRRQKDESEDSRIQGYHEMHVICPMETSRGTKFPEPADAAQQAKKEVVVAKRHKVSRGPRGPVMTAMSIVGTGLAAGQLIAAMACTVM